VLLVVSQDLSNFCFAGCFECEYAALVLKKAPQQ
jgi:hypothetical protein